MRSGLTLVALLFAATGADAQSLPCEKLLCAPTFSLQPGLAVFNAVDAPIVTSSGDRAGRSTEFLMRVATVSPTRLPRLSLLAVVWWTPFMTTEVVNASGERVLVANNAPNFLIGPSFLLLRNGPATLQFAAVDGYRRWEKPDEEGNIDSYRHNLILIPSVNLRVGGIFGPTAPAALRTLSAYGIWQQQVTNMPRDIGRDGRPDGKRAYPPGLFFGITIPIAPSP